MAQLYSVFPQKRIPADMDANALIALYRLMVLARAFDEKGLNLARQGRIAIFYPATGEEAVHVGSAWALSSQDWVFPYYRQSSVFLVRGTPMETLFGQLLGNQADIALGHQSPNHYTDHKRNVVSISSPVGTQISQAVGAAMAIMRQNPRPTPVVMAYFGDGGTSSNDFHAGMTFAGAFHAPVVFVCNNNQWAISMPVTRQTGVKTLVAKASGYGIAGHRVDGNDVLAVYEATRDALNRARNGDGPQFLELYTYRMGPHSTPDDPRRYRSESDLAPWRQRDPLERYRLFLEQQGFWDATKEGTLWQQTRDEVSAALARAEARDTFPWETVFDQVYSTLPPMLAQEKAALRDALAFEEASGVTFS